MDVTNVTNVTNVVNVMNVTNVTIATQSCLHTVLLASLILGMKRKRLYAAEIRVAGERSF